MEIHACLQLKIRHLIPFKAAGIRPLLDPQHFLLLNKIRQHPPQLAGFESFHSDVLTSSQASECSLSTNHRAEKIPLDVKVPTH